MLRGVRKTPLFWGGAFAFAVCAVIAGFSGVEGVRAALLAFACFMLLGAQMGWALGEFSATDELPPDVVALSLASILGNCVWLLCLPSHQGLDGTFVAMAEVFGQPNPTNGDANGYSNVAWIAFALAVLAGGINIWITEQEKRRRRRRS